MRLLLIETPETMPANSRPEILPVTVLATMVWTFETPPVNQYPSLLLTVLLIIFTSPTTAPPYSPVLWATVECSSVREPVLHMPPETEPTPDQLWMTVVFLSVATPPRLDSAPPRQNPLPA